MAKYPKVWYLSGNPCPHLREYWYQIYFQDHHQGLGFTNLQGPFPVGVDFKGYLHGRSVRIEVERDYLSYFNHRHHEYKPSWADVLVVGVLDPPPGGDMKQHLPPTIINIDPLAVLKYTEPLRRAYRETKDAERAKQQQRQRRWQLDAEIVPPENYLAVATAAGWQINDKWKWAFSHPGVVIREIRCLDSSLRVFLNVDSDDDWWPCQCGKGVLRPDDDQPEWDDDLTEGQIADQLAGHSLGAARSVYCSACGRTEVRG